MPPWVYLRGLALFAFTAKPHSFILGHAYPHGVWFYFPVLFLLKSPLTFLLLLLLALAVGLVAKFRVPQLATIPQDQQLHWRAVWVFLVVFTAACMLSGFQISIRHLTVPLALLVLLLSPLPRTLSSLRLTGWPAARAGIWLTVALALGSVLTAVRAYPYYLPFLNSLASGRPGYTLVSDSNFDWNQGLPEVEEFVQQRGLSHILVDEYGFSDPRVYVPQAQFWNCQQPAPQDGSQWAAVSANMIEESHNCVWLLHYPHETLAGGSMVLFQLPAVIPPAGAADGPPLPPAYLNFGGVAFPNDLRLTFLKCIGDPQQLEPTWDGMVASMQSDMEKRKKKKN
jgi:hypothetical protein